MTQVARLETRRTKARQTASNLKKPVTRLQTHQKGSKHMTILQRSYIESVVREIADEFGVKQIELVGSYRRGQAKEDSDIDLIILDDSAPKSGMDFLGMIVALEEALGKEVGLVTAKGLNEDRLRRRVYDRMMEDIKNYA